MGMPKIDAASLQCPQCGGLTRLKAITRSDTGERFSFECGACGSFEVLAPAGSEAPASNPRLIKPGAELQDLWA